MTAPVLKYAVGNHSSTTSAGSIGNTDITIPIDSDTNFQAKSGEGMLLIDEATATEETAYATGITDSILDIPLANRGLEGNVAQAHSLGASVKGVLSAGMWNSVIDALSNVVYRTTGYLDTTKVVDLNTAQTLTNKRLTSPKINENVALTSTATELNLLTGKTSLYTQALTNYSNLNAPEGFLINGKIVPSVSSNHLTVNIKGLDGNDPSATNPVYCRIGGVVRSITAGVGVTENAGGNTCNAGSAEFATKEIDYFVYLCYSSVISSVVLGFSRIPYATIASDFSATSTNEKYNCLGDTGYCGASDAVVNIGRFAATKGAGANYYWSIPTFTATNLIQRPIYETRLLDYIPTWSLAGGTLDTTYYNQTGKYNIRGITLDFSFYMRLNTVSTATATKAIQVSTPFTSLLTWAATQPIGQGRFYDNSGGLQAAGGLWIVSAGLLKLGSEVTDWGAASVGLNPNITLATEDRFGGYVSIPLV
jgi:hypothetical protein